MLLQTHKTLGGRPPDLKPDTLAVLNPEILTVLKPETIKFPKPEMFTVLKAGTLTVQ